MAIAVDMKNVVKHLANGTLDENLCRVCLTPVDLTTENYVNTFTTVYTERHEYCIADVLETLCNIKADFVKNCIICYTCFNTAKAAFSFYNKCMASTEIIRFYTDEIINQSQFIDSNVNAESVCLSLPLLQIDETDDLQLLLSEETVKSRSNRVYNNSDEDDAKCIIQTNNGTFKILWQSETNDGIENKVKRRRKYPANVRRNRNVMPYRDCLKCSVQYRFTSKLIHHMKEVHNLSTFVCKECDTLVTSDEYRRHLQMHTDSFICSTCGASFKKRKTMIEHLLKHSKPSQGGKSLVCEFCGFISLKEEIHEEHLDKCHLKKHTCYYCGKMYKSAISFEAHVRKHELQEESDSEYVCDACPAVFRNAASLTRHVEAQHENARPFVCITCDMRFRSENMLKSHVKTHVKNHVCDICNKRFGDARNLMWHKRLHTDDRPFKCNECERSFVSLNRRNQHQLCAHTAPTKRCPLCPSLFHLTSMVNTHIKKVHLRAHKRNYRPSKYKAMSLSNAETVPLQDLSVSVQNDLLELQDTQHVRELEHL